MRKILNYEKLIIIISLMALAGCEKEEPPFDRFGIDETNAEPIRAMVVNTKIGWTLLAEKYGYLELLEPLRDDWKVDGLLVDAEINRGNTYFDDHENSTDDFAYFENFTYAKVLTIKENPDMYTDGVPPILRTVWSPDYSDELREYPDGFGYFVQATEGGFRIGQWIFPAIRGLGTFKTEVEARKMGMYVLHLILRDGWLPGTDRFDLEFLLIDWYIYIPDQD